MKKLIAIVLLSFAVVSCGKSQPSVKTIDLSYKVYYQTFVPDGAAVIPSCEYVKHTYLDTNLTTGKHFTNYYFTCKETGKNPTIAQQQLWINYVLWHDCKQGSTLACDSDGSD